MSEFIIDTFLNLAIFVTLIAATQIALPTTINQRAEQWLRWVMFSFFAATSVACGVLLFREITLFDLKLLFIYANLQVLLQVVLYFWGPVFGGLVALIWAVSQIRKNQNRLREI